MKGGKREREVVGGSSTAENSHTWVCTRESAVSDAPPKKSDQ